VHSLWQRVLFHIRRQELLQAGDRVGVAVSGGIDSVALLRLLIELRSELGIVLSVVHFNHKLRGAESDADQEFVADLARRHDLQFYCDSDDVAQHAAEERVSVEAAARELRYGFFRSLLEEGQDPEHLRANVKIPTLSPQSPRGQGWGNPIRLDKIATAHTLDDQAETVLMRAVRGAGLRGLSGIYPQISVEDDDGEVCGEIVRPLLSLRRQELKQYLHEIGQSWREDSSNADQAFTRNRVRRLVLPLLEKELNPAAAENLSELAEIARGEEDYWENEVAGWMGTRVHWSEPEWVKASGLVQIAAASPAGGDLRAQIESAAWLVMNASVDRLWFLGEPLAVQRRLVKVIGEEGGIPLEFKHVEEILRFAAGEDHAGKTLSLPLGWKVSQNAHEIVFLTPDLREPKTTPDYVYDLPVPGRVLVRETGMVVEARCIAAGMEAGYNPDQLLDAASLEATVRVRNWRAGDRYWPAHTKSPKKIKELLQEGHLAAAERRAWPVVVSGDEILWVRGFPLPAKIQAKPGQRAILIEEFPARTGLDD
jgi:tRNA(Ile)-lysidine synthase